MRVLTVTADGAQRGWQYLAQCVASLKPGGFIALDTEFSGLCAPQRIENCDLAERYVALRELAKERAMLSLGLSLFNPTDEANSYEVTTLDFLLNCTSKYSIAHDAGAFLVAHGYDFNDMYARGIRYERASDVPKDAKGRGTGAHFEWGPWPRGLLWRLGRASVPIIVHNGFVDLVFLYSAFQGPLPKTLGSFVAALVDCLPGGVYDTKLLAIGVENNIRSYLQYLFAQSVIAGKVHAMERRDAPLAQVLDPSIAQVEKTDELCLLFAANGACRKFDKCPFSHDAFLVVQEVRNGNLSKSLQEQRKEAKIQHKKLKRKRNEETEKNAPKRLTKKQKKKLMAQEAEAVALNSTAEPLVMKPRPEEKENRNIENRSKSGVNEQAAGNGGTSERAKLMDNKKDHTAGWDAFCTGYVFAHYCATLPKKDVEQLHNRVRMMGKGRPLWLHKSKFADADEIQLSGTKASKVEDTPDLKSNQNT